MVRFAEKSGESTPRTILSTLVLARFPPRTGSFGGNSGRASSARGAIHHVCFLVIRISNFVFAGFRVGIASMFGDGTYPN